MQIQAKADKLRLALHEVCACLNTAISYLQEHNLEYHHVTPKEDMEMLERLAKSGMQVIYEYDADDPVIQPAPPRPSGEIQVKLERNPLDASTRNDAK